MEGKESGSSTAVTVVFAKHTAKRILMTISKVDFDKDFEIQISDSYFKTIDQLQ